MKWQSRVPLRIQKKVATFCMAMFFLFAGIEYAVILPTLNDYLKNVFDTKQFFYGLVLSSFSLSGLLVAPFFGTWYDRTHKTKIMIIFANMWEIGGNIMYFIGINEYYVLGGRLLAGVGAGVGSAIFAHVAQTTTEADRASSISILMATRQLGLLLGPGLNLGLSKCDFYIGKFPVNKYTSPGLLMAILWCLQQLIFLFVYFDVPTLDQQRKMAKLSERSSLLGSNVEDGHCNNYETIPNGNSRQVRQRNNYSPVSNRGSINQVDDQLDDRQYTDLTKNSSGAFVTERFNQGLGQHNILADAVGGGSGEYTTLPEDEAYMQHQDHIVDETDEKPPGFLWSLNECLTEEIVVILAVQFVFYFNQPGLETAVVPLTEKYLGFDEIANSILYCLCGVELLIFFVIVKVMSKRVTDRTILLIGVIIETISLVIFTIFIPPSVPGEVKKNFPTFTITCAIQVSGLAFLAVAVISLFSKVVPQKIQGFSQGIRRAVGGLATIMGPLWSGSTVERPFLMFIVMAVLFVLSLIMTLMSWKRLKSKADLRPANVCPPDILNVNAEDTEALLPGGEMDM